MLCKPNKNSLCFILNTETKDVARPIASLCVQQIYLAFRVREKMLELPILAIFATCIAGMIRLFPRKTDNRPVWERKNGKREMEVWLTGFLAKLKRNSTRTEKCRLISSVERMTFEGVPDISSSEHFPNQTLSQSDIFSIDELSILGSV